MLDKNTAKGEKGGTKEQRIESDGRIRLKKTNMVE